MSNFIEAVKKKDFKLIVIVILVAAMTIIIPVAVNAVLKNANASALIKMQKIADAMEVTYKETLAKELAPMRDDIFFVKTNQFNQILNAGIAGYTKISTIEELKSNTQNSAAIKTALSIEPIKDILAMQDLEKTKMFLAYFNLE